MFDWVQNKPLLLVKNISYVSENQITFIRKLSLHREIQQNHLKSKN